MQLASLDQSINTDWGTYIISIVKTAYKKMVALVRSVKFLSADVSLYLYNSTIFQYGILLSCLGWCL